MNGNKAPLSMRLFAVAPHLPSSRPQSGARKFPDARPTFCSTATSSYFQN